MTVKDIIKDLEWRRNDANETAKFWEQKHNKIVEEIENIKSQIKEDSKRCEYNSEYHKTIVKLATRLNEIEKNGEEENARFERIRAMIVFDTIDRIINSYKEEKINGNDKRTKA